MKPTNTIRFFENMAQRMYHENDLSDMVYALCLTNLDFKQFFLDFFFKEAGLKAGDVSIEREVSYPDGSRPDFVIYAEGKVYFVEAKIWDRCHHFAQYSNTLTGTNAARFRLGYITNYKIKREELEGNDRDIFDEIKESRVKLWKEFIANLESPEYATWNNSEEVQGMIAYCKKVCPDISDEEVKNYYKYNAANFAATRCFYSALNKFLQKEPEVVCSGHRIKFDIWRKANIPAETIGFSFGMEDVPEGGQKLFPGKKVWGLAVLRLKGDHKGFCISFDNSDGWGKPIFELLKENSVQLENPSWLPFCFDPPIVADSNSEDFYENYFKEKFGTVVQKLMAPREFKIEGTKIDNMEPYYAVRALPLFIRQWVLPNLKIEGCRISTVYKSDTFSPSGWCGEYFSVSRIAKDSENVGEEKEIALFWLGTYYDGRKGKDGEELLGIVCEQIGGSIETLCSSGKSNSEEINVPLDDAIKKIKAFVCKSVGAPTASPVV